MYESYSKQALPEKNYRELLGTAMCVFNSNNSFVIENILNNDDKDNYNWHNLIDRTSGKLVTAIKETITKKSNTEIADLFVSLVDKRNRIIHSFQITDKTGVQVLSTKEKNGEQYIITEKFLLEFIKGNDELSGLLHKFRGH